MDEILTPDQWYELQSRIQHQHPELTDSELQYHEALEQDMLRMVDYILRKHHEVIDRIRAGHSRLSSLKHYWRNSRNARIRHMA